MNICEVQAFCFQNGIAEEPLSPLRNHADGVFGSQGNFWLYIDGLAGNKAQSPVLCNRDQAERCFHPREGFADALTIAATEGKVSKARSSSLAFCGKAFGIEA